MAVGKRGGIVEKIPQYTDGCFVMYKIKEEKTGDFPTEKLVNTNMKIWYREISVFDRIRYELEQAGKEITMKIRIPRYKGIDSKCACMIDGKIHNVYNAAHVFDKNGFPETELTLIRPGKELEIK